MTLHTMAKKKEDRGICKNIFLCVHRINKVLQVCNDMKMSKCWLNFHFCLNFPVCFGNYSWLYVQYVRSCKRFSSVLFPNILLAIKPRPNSCCSDRKIIVQYGVCKSEGFFLLVRVKCVLGRCCHCPSVGISTALQAVFPSEECFREISCFVRSLVETHNRKSTVFFPTVYYFIFKYIQVLTLQSC